jgi:hypothetical protein
MPGEFDFDMAAASAAISADLGFEPSDSGASDGGDDTTVSRDIPDRSLPADSVPAAPPPQPPVDAAAPAPAPVSPESPLSEAPKTWRREAAAEWATLSPTIKSEIAKREQDIFAGLEGYKADAATGKSFQAAIQPYLPTLRQYNLDPLQQVSGLMQAHFTLATGTPESKLATFQRLAKDYGVDLGQAAPQSDSLYIDPAVQDLRSQLGAVQSQLSQAAQQRAATEQASMVKQIEAFSLDPKNLHFKDVANDMVGLLETRAATTLQEAYEKAIWLNPTVRAREITRQQAETASQAAAAEAARVEAARKATGANVKTKPKSAGAATPLGSIDDTLAETLAAIKARA